MQNEDLIFDIHCKFPSVKGGSAKVSIINRGFENSVGDAQVRM